MPVLPTAVEFIALALLSAGWVILQRHFGRLDPGQVYHLAVQHRDRKRARFYFLSVWIGLIAAFLSYQCLEALANVAFDIASQRDWVLGILRGVGLWGLVIVGSVWAIVGQKISSVNLEGISLANLPKDGTKH